jgi:hypothetical protein
VVLEGLVVVEEYSHRSRLHPIVRKRIMIRTKCWKVAFTLAAMVFVANTALGGTIIHDTFNRTGTLKGSAPSVGPAGNTWTVPGGAAGGAAGHSTDGAVLNMVDAGADSRANLGFTLRPGAIYTLSADVNVDVGGGLAWFAMGFTTSLTDDSSWHEGLHAWMVLRGEDILGGDIGTLAGPNIAGVESFDLTPFTNFGNMSVVLDTTNTAKYKATFLFDDVPVRVAYLGIAPAITGVFVSNSGHSGTFDNLMLTDDAISGTPEPTTMALLSLGGLAVLKRRRRKA